MEPAHPHTPDSSVVDQAIVALASVIYVAGVLVVLTRPATSAGTTSMAPAAVGAGTGTPAASAASTEIATATPLARHRISFDLAPGKGVEFKYRLDKGAGMTYVWTASATVKAEFHGEPDGAREGYADTYKLSEGREGRGTFVAPARGIHGWYWENPGTSPVSLTLESAGFYTAAIEFTAAGPVARPIDK